MVDQGALPPVFLRYQQELMAAVSAHAVTVVEKSRRTGYSWAAGAIAALTAGATRSAGGQDVLYMGYNLEMAREFIDYVADWARQLSPAAVEVAEFLFTDPETPEREIKAFRIEFASGHKVVALPSVPRALRGMQGLVIIDEAAFHDDLDELLKAAFALLIWGGRVLIISTHDGDANPFNVLVNDIRAARKPYHLLRCTFDDALADGLYQRICMVKGETWTAEGEQAWRDSIIAFYGSAADEELFCIPSSGSGTWLSAALIEARSASDIPVLRWECTKEFVLLPETQRRIEVLAWCIARLLPEMEKLDAGTPHCFGWDFGRYHDLTVLWPLAIEANLKRRTPFVLELRNVPSEEQEWILRYVIERLPRFRSGKMDAGGQGFTTAENTMKKFGPNRIEMVTFSEAWYREHMPPLKAAFEDDLVVVPRDREIVDDLRLVRLVRGIARVPDLRTGTKGKTRHGDGAIALALAYAASRSDVVPMEHQTTGKQRMASGLQDFIGG